MIVKDVVVKCDSCGVLKVYDPTNVYQFVPEYVAKMDHIPHEEQLRHICHGCHYKIFSRYLRDHEQKANPDGYDR